MSTTPPPPSFLYHYHLPLIIIIIITHFETENQGVTLQKTTKIYTLPCDDEEKCGATFRNKTQNKSNTISGQLVTPKKNKELITKKTLASKNHHKYKTKINKS